MLARPLFLLTVDVEEEWDWSTGLPHPPYRTENIRCLPAFQSRCEASGLMPTYFVDSAVLEHAENRDILKHYFERGDCDIGAQLHPWCTPPVEEARTERESHTINLDRGLVERKLGFLTEQLVSSFGVHPSSFRCGRWGVDGPLLEMLVRFGYETDSSVRPYYHTEHFSYRSAISEPYWPSFEDVCREGEQRSLLEIPVSDGFSRADFEHLERWHGRLSRAPFSAFRTVGMSWRLGLLKKISMTPEGMVAADLCRCMDRHIERGNRVITLFMHSSDLLPGATEYARDEAGVERLLNTLEICASHARSVHGAEFVTVRRARELLTGSAPSSDTVTPVPYRSGL